VALLQDICAKKGAKAMQLNLAWRQTGLWWFCVAILGGSVSLSTPLVAAAESQVNIRYGDAGLQEVSSFDIYLEGATLHLLATGIAKGEEVQRLHYVRSEDGGQNWSFPVRVETGAALPYRPMPGNDVQIAAYKDHLIALWQTEGTGWAGYGPMVASVSEDGGQHWQRSPSPADHDNTWGQAFMDILADETGRFHVVWVEARDEKQRAEGTTSSVFTAVSTDFGQDWSPNALLDNTTCTCCSTKLAAGKNGQLHVIYRDGQPRDMVLTSSNDGGTTWERKDYVGAFGWDFVGCPHVGAGLVTTEKNQTLHAAVWTGQEAVTGVYYLVSDDGGRHWSSPHRLGDKFSRIVDLAASSDQDL
jgi:hypothetical protein